MSRLSDFLEAQMDNHTDGLLDASAAEICNDPDVRDALNKVALTFSALAVKNMLSSDNAIDPMAQLMAMVASTGAAFGLGFELGIRWAETKALEAEHA